MRLRYAGAITLDQQETYAKSLEEISKRNVHLEAELKEATAVNHRAEDTIAGLEVEKEELQVSCSSKWQPRAQRLCGRV